MTYHFFLGGYDLEMVTIRDLLQEAGQPFCDKRLAWGARASHLNRRLAPILDRMFEPESVGYRKGYSREHATLRIQALLREGYRYVVESDIDDFFPSVDLDRLEAMLRAQLPAADQPLCRLIGAFLRTGYVLDGEERKRERGLAQGAPLSPLLANLYLDAFDDMLKEQRVRLIRYADDLVLLARERAEAERALGLAEDAAAELGLALDRDKTAIRSVEEGFSFLGMAFGREVPAGAELRLAARKPLYLTEPGLFLGVNGEAVELRKGGALIETLPLRRLSEILVMERCAVSSALLRKCVRGGIPITFTLGSGYHIATLAPDSRHHHDIAYRQARRYYSMSETERLALASAFATVKIQNYLALFRQRYEAGTAEFLTGLEGLIETMQGADTVAAVRGLEGAAARRIFKRLNQHIAVEALRSPSRKRQDPDRLNSLLNFGYYLLFSRLNAALRALGLNPYLGFLHDGRDDYESLVCDVQELFRARIDRLVLRLVNLKVIKAEQFKETERGLRLLPEAAKAYVLHFERELAQREAAGELGLGQILHAQCLNLKLHLCDGQPLALYKWQV